ncbi:MAG: carbon monoxide dehydrogenase [Candidatus Marinimicrobia bacterium]|nr:carbon monoxide dehydrogenase [Candidatus Neomarinimicrobiota bacterium]
MDMKGECVIPAPRKMVWAALNNVEILKTSIPGCQSIQRLSDTEIEAVVMAKVGPVKATFKGLVILSELDPPNGYTIRGEGKGGAAGFAKGGAKVKLVDDSGGTLLSYDVEAAVGGKLAQIGGRLITSTAKKLADEFFAKFSEIAALEASDTLESEVSCAASPSGRLEPAGVVMQSEKRSLWLKGRGRWFLIPIVLAIVVLAAIYGLSRS